jgi:hypothetical protein
LGESRLRQVESDEQGEQQPPRADELRQAEAYQDQAAGEKTDCGFDGHRDLTCFRGESLAAGEGFKFDAFGPLGTSYVRSARTAWAQTIRSNHENCVARRRRGKVKATFAAGTTLAERQKSRCPMNHNEATIDRIIRVVLGLGLLSLTVIGPQTWFGLIGLIPLATGIVGYCPLYGALGVRTCRAAPTISKPYSVK